MSRSPTIEVKFTGDTTGLSNATGRVEGEISGLGKKVSGFAVGAGAALTTMGIQAIPALVNFGTELYSLGQSSEIALAKSSTVFGDSADEIAKWADGVNESLGLSDEAVIGLAAGMGDLLVPLGFTREAAAGMSMETTELAGALSAWSQGQYDSAQVSEILTKAMLGERDGLKALGISISQAEVDERALAVAKSEGRDAITAQDKAIATQQLIMEKSTDAQTAWADGTMDAVKNQNELSATIADAKEELAKGLVPIVQKTIKWIVRDFIPAVKRLVDIFKRYWPEIKATVMPIMIAIRDIVTDVVSAIAEIWRRYGSDIMDQVRSQFEYIRSTIEAALKVVQGIIDVVMGLISGDWSRVWEGIKGIVSGVWDAIMALLTRFVDIMSTLLAVAWEGVQRAARGAWEGLKTTISNAIGGIVTFHRELPGRLIRALGSISSLLWQKGRDLIDGLKRGAELGATLAKGWIKGLPGALLRSIGNLGSILYNAGRSLIGGLLRGMKDAATGMFSWAGGLAGRIASIKGPPSYDRVVLESNGRLLISGLLNGMKQEWPQVERFAGGLAPRLSGALSAAGAGSIPMSSSSSTRSSSTTIINNIPVGVTPTNVMQSSRQYARNQGPV